MPPKPSNVTYDIDANFQGTTLLNQVQITADDGDDVDSDPDQDYSTDDKNDSNDDDDEDEVSIPVGQVYDLAIDKSITSSGPYQPGGQVTFAIVVTNEGSLDAADVEVTDNPASGLTFASSDAGSNTNVTENADNLWTIASLPSGASETINVTYDIDTDFQGSTLVNRVQITADDGDDVDSDPDQDYSTDDKNDSNDDDDEDEVSVPVEQTYDLALAKMTIGQGPFRPGDNITYQITLTNEGRAPATNVEVTDNPGAHLTFVSSNANTLSNVTQVNDSTYVIGSLLALMSQEIQVTYRIDPDFMGDQVVNRAQITRDDGDDEDSDPDRDYEEDEDGDNDPDDDDEDEETTPVEQTYDLALTKVLASAGPFAPGDQITYRIRVTNEGTLDANNVQITDNPDPALSFVSSDAGSNANVTEDADNLWTVAALPAGASEDIQVTYRIDASFQGDQVRNRAQITRDDGDDEDSNPDRDYDEDEDGDNDPDDDDEDEETTPVEQTYDLALTKVLASAGPFTPGDQITYRIRVTNEGTLDASNVQVTDNPDPALSFISSDAGSNTNVTEDADNLWTLASLPAGSSEDIVVTYRIATSFGGSHVRNRAQITRDDGDDEDSDPDRDYEEDEDGDNDPDDDDEDEENTPLQLTYDLALTKQVMTPGPYYPSDLITYRLRIVNQGNANAANIQVTDNPGVGLTFVNSDAAGDPNVTQDAPNLFTIASLPVGALQDIMVVYRINQDYAGDRVVNQAQITRDDGDDVDSDPDRDYEEDEDGDNDPDDDDEDGVDLPLTIPCATDIDLSATLTSPICTGDTDGQILLTVSNGAAPYTFRWNTGASSQNLTGLGAGTYSVTVEDRFGCTATDSYVLTEPPAIQLRITVTNATCAQNNGAIDLQVTGRGGPMTYLWSNGATTQDLTNLAPGTYEVTVSDAQNCGKSARATVQRSISDLRLTVTADPLTCARTQTRLSVQSTANIVSYRWSGPNGFTSTSSQPTVSEPGTYTLQASDAAGCPGSGQVVVVADRVTPNIVASGGDLGCQGSLRLQGGSSTPGVQFAWTGPNGFTSNQQNPVVVEEGTYTLRVSASNGCIAEQSVTVKAGGQGPEMTITADQLDCSHSSVQIIVTSSETIVQHSWVGPQGFSSTELNPFVRLPGVYRLTATSSSGCSTSEEIEITSDIDIPHVQASGGTIDCASDKVQLMGTSLTPGVSFRWVGPSGFTSDEANPVVDLPGQYMLTVSAPNGCTNQATAMVDRETEGPAIMILGTAMACGDSTTTLMLDLDDTTGWSVTWTGPEGFTSTHFRPVVRHLGTYQVTATYNDGCQTEESFDVTRSEDLDFLILIDTFDCNRPAIRLEWQSETEIIRSFWIDPAGLIIEDRSPVVTKRGRYQLVLESVEGCVDTGAVETVDNTFEPDIQAEGGVLDGCDTLPFYLFGFSSTPDVTYRWTGPNGFMSNLPSPPATDPGRYVLSVTGPNGCEVSTRVNVLIDSCEGVGDRVWIDADCDGIQDTLEVGAAGIVVQLYTCDTILVDEQRTDENGRYRFVDLIPGQEYFLKYLLPDSATFSPANTGDREHDSDVIGPEGRTKCFSIEDSQMDLSWDAGICVKEDTSQCEVVIIATRYDCRGDSALLEARVPNMVTYQWAGHGGFASTEPSIAVPAHGQYWLEVTDFSGCVAVDSIDLDTFQLHAVMVEQVLVPCDSIGVWTSVVSTVRPHTRITWIRPDGHKMVGDSAFIYLAGLYWIVVEDTLTGCYDKFLVEFASVCCNILDGGVLGYDESQCGAYDPQEIVSILDPSGGYGPIEYMWIKTDDPSLPYSKWDRIWRADEATYDPPMIMQTTYYTRCARRKGCTDWLPGETNVIKKEVLEVPVIVDSTIHVIAEQSCDANDGSIRFALASDPAPPYEVIIFSDKGEVRFGPFADSMITLSPLKPGTYYDLEVRSGQRCYSGLLDSMLVVDSASCQISNRAVLNVYPNPSKGIFTLEGHFDDGRNASATLEVIDPFGRKQVVEKNIPVIKGSLQVAAEIEDELLNGLYYLRISSKGDVKMIPLNVAK